VNPAGFEPTTSWSVVRVCIPEVYLVWAYRY